MAICLLGASEALFLQSRFGRCANTFIYGVPEPADVPFGACAPVALQARAGSLRLVETSN